MLKLIYSTNQKCWPVRTSFFVFKYVTIGTPKTPPTHATQTTKLLSKRGNALLVCFFNPESPPPTLGRDCRPTYYSFNFFVIITQFTISLYRF